MRACAFILERSNLWKAAQLAAVGYRQVAIAVAVAGVEWRPLEVTSIDGYAAEMKRAREGYATVFELGPVRSAGRQLRAQLLLQERIVGCMTAAEKAALQRLELGPQQMEAIASRCSTSISVVQQLQGSFLDTKRQVEVVAGWRQQRLVAEAEGRPTAGPSWDQLLGMDLPGYHRWIKAALRGEATTLVEAASAGAHSERGLHAGAKEKLQLEDHVIRCIPRGVSDRPLIMTLNELQLLASEAGVDAELVVAILAEFCSLKRLPLRLAQLHLLDPLTLPASIPEAIRLQPAAAPPPGRPPSKKALLMEQLTLDRYLEYLDTVVAATYPTDPLRRKQLPPQRQASLAWLVMQQHIIRHMTPAERRDVWELLDPQFRAIGLRCHRDPLQVVKCLREYVKWAEGFASRALRRLNQKQPRQPQ